MRCHQDPANHQTSTSPCKVRDSQSFLPAQECIAPQPMKSPKQMLPSGHSVCQILLVCPRVRFGLKNAFWILLHVLSCCRFQHSTITPSFSTFETISIELLVCFTFAELL